VDEEEVKNLRTALRQGLCTRHFGQAVRLEVSAGCSEYLSSFLLRSSACRRRRCTGCTARSTWCA
jgi:polyphosphate kinase